MNPYRKYIEPEHQRLARLKAQSRPLARALKIEINVVDLCLFALFIALSGAVLIIA